MVFMPEETIDPKEKEQAPTPSAPKVPYPNPDDETGEDQQNRLGYMVTEPTEEELEEDETSKTES
jgi:hypothetical protein